MKTSPFNRIVSQSRRFLVYPSVVLIVCLGVMVRQPEATEIYTIIGQDCRASTGLIINVDNENVYQIDLDGNLIKTPRHGIEHILVYNTIDNPIASLNLSGEIRQYAREVRTSADDENGFIGWPIRFIENLIVFYDLQGKTHIVNVEEIQKFKIPKDMPLGRVDIETFKRMTFGLGNNLPECRSGKPADNGMIRPTRMLSDQIKISKFISIYYDGFVRLNRLQKRTAFYARPYVFDRKTKIALVIQRDDFQEEFSAGFPVHFQWPTGSTFGPQGFLSAGSDQNENLPNVEPVFELRFDGKYHFLSASFAGNPFAFSAGSDYMIRNRFFMGDFFEKRGANNILILPQFNQIAFTGLERGAYSMSVGYYYPIYGLQANGIFREILSQTATTIYKFQYTRPKYRIGLVGASVNMGSGGPGEEDIKLIYADEMPLQVTLTNRSRLLQEQIEEFSFESTFLRFNLDLDISEKVSFLISEVLMNGDYSEQIAGDRYKLGFNEAITSFGVHQNFGEDVSLKGYINYFMRNFDSQTTQDSHKNDENKFSFSIAVEFIL